MSKILIIGQAPPSIKQRVPYDTTMLYEIFSWVGISKEDAQDIFEFDAVYDKFPGFNSKGGHLPPNEEQMEEYWDSTLFNKVAMSNKVIILGNVARDFIQSNTICLDSKFLFLLHPSRLNYNRILERKSYIIEKLSNFIKN